MFLSRICSDYSFNYTPRCTSFSLSDFGNKKKRLETNYFLECSTWDSEFYPRICFIQSKFVVFPIYSSLGSTRNGTTIFQSDWSLIVMSNWIQSRETRHNFKKIVNFSKFFLFSRLLKTFFIAIFKKLACLREN